MDLQTESVSSKILEMVTYLHISNKHPKMFDAFMAPSNSVF